DNQLVVPGHDSMIRVMLRKLHSCIWQETDRQCRTAIRLAQCAQGTQPLDRCIHCLLLSFHHHRTPEQQSFSFENHHSMYTASRHYLLFSMRTYIPPEVQQIVASCTYQEKYREAD